MARPTKFTDTKVPDIDFWRARGGFIAHVGKRTVGFTRRDRNGVYAEARIGLNLRGNPFIRRNFWFLTRAGHQDSSVTELFDIAKRWIAGQVEVDYPDLLAH